MPLLLKNKIRDFNVSGQSLYLDAGNMKRALICVLLSLAIAGAVAVAG